MRHGSREDGAVMCVGKVRKAEIHARFKKKEKRKGFMMLTKGRMVYFGLFSISQTLEDPKALIMAAKTVSISRWKFMLHKHDRYTHTYFQPYYACYAYTVTPRCLLAQIERVDWLR